MNIGYFEFIPSSLILVDNLQFSDPSFTDTLDIDYLVDSPIESTIWPHIRKARITEIEDYRLISMMMVRIQNNRYSWVIAILL